MAYLRIDLVPQLDSEDYPHVLVLAYTDFAQTYRRIHVEEFSQYGSTHDDLVNFMSGCDEFDDNTPCEFEAEIHGLDKILELLEIKPC